MSLNYNKVILAGRLTAAPELKQTPNGVAVTSFSIAVSRQYQKDQTDFIDCVAWRQTAEFIAKYFAKGSSIALEGRIQVRSYLKDDEKRYATEVVVDEVYFVDSKSDARMSETEAAAAKPTSQTTRKEHKSTGFPPGIFVPGWISSGPKNSVKTSESNEPLIRDDELPF